MTVFSRPVFFALGLVGAVTVIGAGACSGSPEYPGLSGSNGGFVGSGGAGGDLGQGGSSGTVTFDAGNLGAGGSGVPLPDPTTCGQAAENKAYIGCDFWPTVTANNVWSTFDFAAVVANAGPTTATVTVTGAGSATQTVLIAPNSLEKIYLPWVPALKGPDFDACTSLVPMTASVSVPGGAYHLISTVPVTVYQFNALEYRPAGGPPGKSWASCQGNLSCASNQDEPVGCFSFSNDASLLLPTTAMTGNYRITSEADWSIIPEGATLTVTGTRAGTNVTVYVAPGGHIVGGGGIADTPGGGTVTFTVGAGDVVELVSDGQSDLAGSLIKATAPVQVIAGMPCVFQPFQTGQSCASDADCTTGDCNTATGVCLAPACDHIEQSVFPAETLGKHYFVSQPTAPHSTAATPVLHGHIVRLIGNVDGTTLDYPGGPPSWTAPILLGAGQVVDLGIVDSDFEVVGSDAFAVVTFMLGASEIDPSSVPPDQLGDPSQSNAVGIEQYRVKYVFLAPTDYTESYVDVTMPISAQVTLDGVGIAATPTAISSGYGIARVPLGAGADGAHVLIASAGVGIQVIGYGQYTSYQYPGGLNLEAIAPPPPPPPPTE
jgi:IgGFc binding protein